MSITSRGSVEYGKAVGYTQINKPRFLMAGDTSIGKPTAASAFLRKADAFFATLSVLVATARTECAGKPRSRSPKRIKQSKARA